MIKKKICMLGSFAVGKTSLVQMFVNSIFSEKYHTTIGVKIDKKVIQYNDKEVNLMLWDIHGEDEYQTLQSSYLLGSAGYFIVIDGTRKSTIEVAKKVQQFTKESIGNKPFIVLINKNDLKDEWEIESGDIEKMQGVGWEIIKTSAKTGEGVEDAFRRLTARMLDEP